jgi:hypothetical protein
MRRRDGSEGAASPPRIRRAVVLELRIYEITESELDRLARGPSASLFLNFALTLLPISLTLLLTLTTTRIDSIYLFATYVAVAAVTMILGLLLLALWWRSHSSQVGLIEEIRNRMPPTGVQDTPGMTPGES